MEEGKLVRVRVSASGPPPVLRLIADSPGARAPLIHPPRESLEQVFKELFSLLDKQPADGSLTEELRGALDGLKELITFSPDDPGRLAESLPKLVRYSGLFQPPELSTEENLLDLESLSLALAKGREEGDAISRLARALLSHVEVHQARSAVQGEPVIPLVLAWGGEWICGELTVRDEGSRARGRGESGSRSMHLQLRLPNLGWVSVGVRWDSARVTVRLALDHRFVELAQARLDELRASIAEHAAVAVVELRAELLSPAGPAEGSGFVEVLA